MMPLPFKFIGLASYLSLGLWLLIRLLRDKYARSVQTIWYLFALAFHVSLILLWWASAAHAIDSDGKPNGAMGASAMKLMTAMLDIKTDVQIMFALASLVVLPQIASYILSSVFGCASRPKLIAVTADWLSWGVTKSFAVTSAILISVTIWGAAKSWHGFDQNAIAGYLNISSILLLFSFTLLLIKYEITEIPKLAMQHPSNAVAIGVLRLHRWATRHRKDLNRMPVIDQSQPVSDSTNGVVS